MTKELSEYKKAIEELEKLDVLYTPDADYNFDFQDLCFEIAEKFRRYNNPEITFEPILNCFDRQATNNFGVHAELLGFMQEYSIEQLKEVTIKSIKKKPTPQSLYLLNRIINSDSDNLYFKDLMSSIALDEYSEEMVRGVAEMFCENYRNN